MASEVIFYGEEAPPQLPSDILTMDYLMGDLYIPDGETIYACVAFRFPDDKVFSK